MKICKHCSTPIDDDLDICPKCGALADSYIDNKEYTDIYSRNKKGKRIFNKRLIGWFIFGLFLWEIAFWVYLIFRSNGEYDRARAISRGCLCGLIVSVIIGVIIRIVNFNFESVVLLF